jgi:predicted transcriptional regulator
MPRKKSKTLTEAELKLMDILWTKGEGTVQDVLDALSERESFAYTTVLTILRILERKGYLKHRKLSRAFVYYPVVKRDEVSRSAVKDIMRKFFDDSPELLVLSVIENEEIDADELSRLKDMIEKYEETDR